VHVSIKDVLDYLYFSDLNMRYLTYVESDGSLSCSSMIKQQSTFGPFECKNCVLNMNVLDPIV
jgi:hypothetical protein